MRVICQLIEHLADATREAEDFARLGEVCEHDMLVSMYTDLAEHELAQARIIVEHLGKYVERAHDDASTRELFGEAELYARERLQICEQTVKRLK